MTKTHAAATNQSGIRVTRRQVVTDPTNKFVIVGKKKGTRTEVSYAKLLSIAKGLQHNILPKTHAHLNEIYELRLRKYLNLKAIYGEDNQTIADKLFDAEGDTILADL